MKTEFPCEPKKYFKSFQETPRPIQVYDFDCKTEGIKFLITSKNYMDEVNEKSIQNVFENKVSFLKTQFGEIQNFDVKSNFLTNGFQSKYYDVSLKSGGKLKSLVVVNKVRFYNVLVGVNQEKANELKNKNIDFEEIGNKFIKSFQIIDKE